MNILKRIFRGSKPATNIQAPTPTPIRPEDPYRKILNIQRLEKELIEARKSMVRSLVQEYKSGRNISEIAKRYRLGHQTVRKHIRRQGLDTPRAKKVEYTEADVDYWLSLLYQGKSPKEIVDDPKVNVSYWVIKDNIRNRGISVRNVTTRLHDQKAKKAYEMRLAGNSWKKIAAKLEDTPGNAFSAAKKHAKMHSLKWPLMIRRPSRGKEIYEMRLTGKSWSESCKTYDRNRNGGTREAQRYAERNRLPWPPAVDPNAPIDPPPFFPEWKEDKDSGSA